MFSKVLLPTDFSGYSQAVVNCVGEIPGIQEVILQHVVDAAHLSKHGWTHGPHIANAKILLDEDKYALEQRGLAASPRVDVIKEGSIPDAILHCAEQELVSLIVMGAKGKSLTELLLGSVSSDILHRAKTSLLLMRFRGIEETGGKRYEQFCPHLFSKILIPTDFSPPSEDALTILTGIKGVKTLVLLNVVEARGAEAEIEHQVKEANQHLSVIRDGLEKSGFSVTTHVRVGYPPDEIISLAERDEVSLIVMSPTGEGLMRELRELVVGSTTTAVARRSARPLLVLRTRS